MLSFEGNEQGPPSPVLRRDGRRSCRPDGAWAESTGCGSTAAGASASRAACTAGTADPDLPHRHQLRSGRRHRHRPSGQPRGQPEAGRFRGDGGRQAPGDSDLQTDQRLREHRCRQRAAAAGTHRHRRAGGSGTGRCTAVRGVPRRLSRAPRKQHARARSDRAVRREPAAASRHGGDHVPVVVDQRCAPLPESQRDGERHPRVHRPEVRLHAAEHVRRELRSLRLDHRGRADSQRRDADRAQGPDRQNGRTARGSQGHHPHQRRVHQCRCPRR